MLASHARFFRILLWSLVIKTVLILDVIVVCLWFLGLILSARFGLCNHHNYLVLRLASFLTSATDRLIQLSLPIQSIYQAYFVTKRTITALFVWSLSKCGFPRACLFQWQGRRLFFLFPSRTLFAQSPPQSDKCSISPSSSLTLQVLESHLTHVCSRALLLIRSAFAEEKKAVQTWQLLGIEVLTFKQYSSGVLSTCSTWVPLKVRASSAGQYSFKIK